MSNKVIGWGIVSVIVIGFAWIVIANWDTIKGIFGKGAGLKVCKDLTSFECIKKHGAVLTTATTAGDRYEYGGYGFYSNNRVVELSSGRKGSYDKIKIKWDDGTETKMTEIFK